MATKKQKSSVQAPPTVTWPFGKKNYVLFGIALVVIIIGYICLGYGDDPDNPVSLTLAPIVLVVGYFLVPFAIMARGREENGDRSKEPPTQE